jgi:hypothetical protein
VDRLRIYGLDRIPQILEAIVLLTALGQLLRIIVSLEFDRARIHRVQVFGCLDLNPAPFVSEAIHIDGREMK